MDCEIWLPTPDRAFWDQHFPTATANGTKPFLFKNLVPPSLRDPEEIANAWRRLQVSDVRERTGVRTRLYFGETRDERGLEAALSTPMRSDEHLTTFIERAVGAARFMLTINNFERVSPRMSAAFGVFTKTMFEARGVPIGGCEQVVFAGNYAGTAFGIHEGYEHAFLAHLGPAPKDFYCWPRELYFGLNGNRHEPTFGDYEWMLEHAEHFFIEPGDVLYLPAKVFHVGKQVDYSVSIAIPIYTFPVDRYLSRTLIPAAVAKVPFDLDGMSSHLPLSFSSSPLQEVYLPAAEKLVSQLVTNDLPQLLSYVWYSMLSNGFWEPGGQVEATDLDSTGLHLGDRIRLAPPYQVCWQSGLSCSEDQVRIFLRSQSVVVAWYDELPSQLTRLNLSDAIELTSTSAVESFESLRATGGLLRLS